MSLPYKETLIQRLPIWDEKTMNCNDVIRVVYTISSIRPIVDRASERKNNASDQTREDRGRSRVQLGGDDEPSHWLTV